MEENRTPKQKEWSLHFTARRGKASAEPDGRLVENGRSCAGFYCGPENLEVRVRTYARETPLILRAPLGEETEFSLVWRGSRVELMLGADIVDEEWPIGDCIRGEDIRLKDGGRLKFSQFADASDLERDSRPLAGGAQYYAPLKGGTSVGDCMPFYSGGVFHVYFLKDRHSHKSKWGLGAHQFAHISSADLVHWEEHPLAVPITHDWEGSICTGSVLFARGSYYAFYAVRMSDQTSARLSWAVSRDGVHFEKSERYFSLTEPYEPVSARDPEVFLGADGKYHMLVTTELTQGAPAGREGCLAHLVSEDLEEWEQLAPFYIPCYTDQPECANYFSWNGWYYLVFSNYGCAKYRYSRRPFGPWEKPEQELLDGPLYRVPKTAAFAEGRRIACGFLANAADGESYAGNLVFRELLQNPDGTLSTGFVPELLKPLTGKTETVELGAQDGCLYAAREWRTFESGFRLILRALPSQKTVTYGLILDTGEEAFELRAEPFADRIVCAPANSSPFAEEKKKALHQVQGLEGETEIELIWHRGILDLCVGGNRTLVCRATERREVQRLKLSCFVKDGGCRFELEW